MISLKSEFLTFLWSFVSHWQSYATGGAVTGLIGVGERLWGKSLPKKVYFFIFVVTFSFVSFFMAWREQYERAQSESVYVETHIEPVYVGHDNKGEKVECWLYLDHPLDAKFIWTRTGQNIAEDVNGMGMIFLGPDTSLATQRNITTEFQMKFDKLIAGLASAGSEGATLGYSDESKSVWETATDTEERPILTKDLASKLWSGSEIMYVVAAASYKTEGGQRYESHFCNWLAPLNESSIAYSGKPMPTSLDLASAIMTFHNCYMYHAPIKK